MNAMDGLIITDSLQEFAKAPWSRGVDTQLTDDHTYT